jgi:putative flippase GtrA
MTGSGRLLARLTRYAAVSGVSTSVTLSLLGVMIYTRALSAGWANVVATAVGTIPSFELNRRWVWAKPGRRSVMKEVVPFCALSTGSGLGHAAVTLISQGANVSTFGALWALQYVLLDRALFGRRSDQGAAGVHVDELEKPEPIELEDAA